MRSPGPSPGSLILFSQKGDDIVGETLNADASDFPIRNAMTEKQSAAMLMIGYRQARAGQSPPALEALALIRGEFKGTSEGKTRFGVPRWTPNRLPSHDGIYRKESGTTRRSAARAGKYAEEAKVLETEPEKIKAKPAASQAYSKTLEFRPRVNRVSSPLPPLKDPVGHKRNRREGSPRLPRSRSYAITARARCSGRRKRPSSRRAASGALGESSLGRSTLVNDSRPESD